MKKIKHTLQGQPFISDHDNKWDIKRACCNCLHSKDPDPASYGKTITCTRPMANRLFAGKGSKDMECKNNFAPYCRQWKALTAFSMTA